MHTRFYHIAVCKLISWYESNEGRLTLLGGRVHRSQFSFSSELLTQSTDWFSSLQLLNERREPRLKKIAFPQNGCQVEARAKKPNFAQHSKKITVIEVSLFSTTLNFQRIRHL